MTVTVHFKCPWCLAKCEVVLRQTVDMSQNEIPIHINADDYRACERCKQQFKPKD